MSAYTQGLMDLGATLCQRREPQCLLCPLQAHCLAHRRGTTNRYPVKTRKLKRSRRENWRLWLSTADALWLQQRPATGVWAGLWSLPLFDSAAALQHALHELQATLPLQATEPSAAFDATHTEPTRVVMPPVQHVLTHFDWTLHPHRWQLSGAQALGLDPTRSTGADGRWVPYADLDCFGLPAPLRKLLGAAAMEAEKKP